LGYCPLCLMSVKAGLVHLRCLHLGQQKTGEFPMRKLFAAALLAAFSVSANAVVINTLDGQQYQWLELTETQGMSRDQVELAMLDESSNVYGYEYASRALVESLLLSYASWDGLTGYHGDASVVAGIASHLNDFGVTRSAGGSGINGPYNAVDGYTVQHDGTENGSYGLYGLESECGRSGASCVTNTLVYSDASGTPTMAYQDAAYGWDSLSPATGLRRDSTPDPDIGSYLVTTVPIPAAVWLFGSALAGLGWMRRRKTAL
jgi:hypothetical protein